MKRAEASQMIKKPAESARGDSRKPPGQAHKLRNLRRTDLSHIVLGSNDVGRMINHDVILQLIRSLQPISRADLARISGLQRSTVSQIVGQLLEERWVVEGANRQTSRGRWPVMLSLNDELVTLAVDLHPRQAVVAIVDLRGRILSSNVLPVGTNPERSVRVIIDAMKRLRGQHPDRIVEGIGISAPGRVEAKTQRLLFAPNLHWPAYDLKQAIEREMGLPTEIENAANASLMSELWFGRISGARDVVLLTVSDGIGGGIMAGGKLVRGHYGTAGEFGHIQMDPAGELCACGQVGCWETLASSGAAIRHYCEKRMTTESIRYGELLQLAEEGDRDALDAIGQQASSLARGMRMVAMALSPELILVAGGLIAAWDRFLPAIEHALANPPLPGGMPRIDPLHEGDMARVRGAAAVLLERQQRYLMKRF